MKKRMAWILSIALLSSQLLGTASYAAEPNEKMPQKQTAEQDENTVLEEQAEVKKELQDTSDKKEKSSDASNRTTGREAAPETDKSSPKLQSAAVKPGELISTSTGVSAEEMAKELLGGSLNIVPGTAKLTYNSKTQAGRFSSGEALLGIDAGIVLSTGDASAAFKAKSDQRYGGTCKDADLKKLVTGDKSGDTSILEFELVATGTLLNFQYVFGSCEFDQGVEYNDVFALFVSVNGSQYENIALLPDGNSVSITNLKKNNSYYTADNSFKNSGFNGISNILTAQKTVQKGDSVKIKIGICDVGDTAFDSSVMIKGGSLNFDPPGAKPSYEDERLKDLDADALYQITSEGIVYLITADADGTIAIVGEDDNKKSYDFFGKQIEIIRKGTAGTPDSPPQELELPQKPDAPTDPSVPTNTPEDIQGKDVATTTESIVITAKEGQEYSIDGGKTWTVPTGKPLQVTFDGLSEDTEYTVFSRYAATDSSFASRPSAGVEVRTKAMFKAGDIIFTSSPAVYDGMNHTVAGVKVPDNAKITYSKDLNGTYSESLPQYKNVGEYTFYYCVEKDNYYNGYGTMTVSVTAKELIVTPDQSQKKMAGQADPILTYNYSGNIDGEIPGFSGTLSRETGEETGTYTILQNNLTITDNFGDNFQVSNYNMVFPAVGGNAVTFEIIRAQVSAGDFVVDGYYEEGTPAVWNKKAIKVKPGGDYTSISIDGINWDAEVSGDVTGADKELTFYLKKDDGTVTEAKTIYYNLDTDTPSMDQIMIGTDILEELTDLSLLTKIYPDTVQITLTAADQTSGIAEYVYELADGTKKIITAENHKAVISVDPQYKGNIKVAAVDMAGNKSAEKVYEYFAVDNKMPGKPSVSAGTYQSGVWTADEVTITLEKSAAISGIEKYQYSADNGATWTDIAASQTENAGKDTPSNAVKAEISQDLGAKTYLFRAVSNSGIAGEASDPFSVRIDIEVPETDADAGSYDGNWTNSDVNIQLSNPNQNPSGVTYEYTLDEGKTWVKVNGISLTIDQDTNAVYQFRAVSGTGIVGAATDKITVRVQKTSPECARAEILGTSLDGWFTEFPQIQITPSDATDGDNKTYYKLYETGKEPQDGTLLGSDVPKIEKDGTYELKVWTVDAAGNISETETKVIKVDTVAPVFGIVDIKTKNTGTLASIGRTLSFGHFFKETVEVSIGVTDAWSGVDKVQYKLPKGTYQEAKITHGTAIFDIPLGTDGTIQIQAFDKAGNQNAESNLTKDGTDVWAVENTAPVISDITLDKMARNGWYKEDVTLTANISEDNSGLNKVSALYDEKEVVLIQDPADRILSYDYTKKITANGTTKVKLKAEDNATNLSAVKEVEIKLDKKAPEVTDISGNPAAWQKEEAKIKFHPEDSLSGIAGDSVKVTKDGSEIASEEKEGTWSFSTEGNGNYVITVEDAAGNSATETVSVTKIQTTPPTPPVPGDIDSGITIGGDAGQTEGLPSTPDGWYTKADVEIGLTNPAAAEGQPNQEYYYKIWKEGSNPEDAETVRFGGSNPPVLDKDGIWNVSIWLEDEAGNKSDPYTKQIKVDAAAPAASSSQDHLTVKNGDAQTAEVVLSDQTSGLDKELITVTRKGEETEFEMEEKDGKCVITFDVKKGGIYIIRSQDEAGNTTEFPVTVTALNADTSCAEGVFGTVDPKALLDAADLSEYNSGETVTLTLDMKVVEESKISKEQAQKITELTRKDVKMYALDIQILKTVETAEGEVSKDTLTSLDKKIKITVDIPEKVRGKYNYKVVREHDGSFEILDTQLSKDGTKITFETDKFSLYSLTYTESKAIPKPADPSPQKPGTKPSQKPAAVKAPSTGDSMNTAVWFIYLFMMCGVIGITVVYRRKKSK